MFLELDTDLIAFVKNKTRIGNVKGNANIFITGTLKKCKNPQRSFDLTIFNQLWRVNTRSMSVVHNDDIQFAILIFTTNDTNDVRINVASQNSRRSQLILTQTK